MWDRIRGGRSQVKRHTEGTNSRPGRRSRPAAARGGPGRPPVADRLVATDHEPQRPRPARGHHPLARRPPPPTRRPSRSPPATRISSHRSPRDRSGTSASRTPTRTTPANDFTGTLTFQLFQSLTPNTVSEITNFTNDGYYVNTGKYFTRISRTGLRRSGRLADPQRVGAQSARSPSPTKTSSNWRSPAPINSRWPTPAEPTPIPSQFFITPARQNARLGYDYTIFGQMLTGMTTLHQDDRRPGR